MATGLNCGKRKTGRILIIADARSPLSRDRGVVGLQRDHQVYWYSRLKPELNGLAGVRAPSFARIWWLSPFFSPLFLKRAMDEIQPDLIHVFYAYQQLDNLVLCRFTPLVLTVMGGDVLPDQSFKGRRKWPIKKLLDSAEVITSKSAFLDNAISQIGNYAHKIRRVTWGVDTKRFRPGVEVDFLRHRWDVQPDDNVFFCPRICKPFYNQHLIIQAFADYVHRIGSTIKAKLIIAELFAEASYLGRLRTLAKELNVMQHMRFVGAIPQQEMAAYYNLADIMVAIPPSDGMPQSLYEAMACGSYPILGNLPQYQEMVQHGVNSRLVKVGDVSSLSEAMEWALAHPEERKAAATINRQRVMEVADKDTQDRLVHTIYDELMEKYGKWKNDKTDTMTPRRNVCAE